MLELSEYLKLIPLKEFFEVSEQLTVVLEELKKLRNMMVFYSDKGDSVECKLYEDLSNHYYNLKIIQSHIYHNWSKWKSIDLTKPYDKQEPM